MKMKKIVALIAVASVTATTFTAISVPTVSALSVDTDTEYSEDFEGFTELNQQNTLQTLKDSGWYACDHTKLYTDVGVGVAPYSTINYKLANIATVDGSKVLRIVTAGEAAGDPQSSYGYGRALPGVAANGAATGVYSISFDYKPILGTSGKGANKTQFYFGLNTADGSAANNTDAQHNILSGFNTSFYAGYRNYMTLYNNGSSIPQGTLAAEKIGGVKWYTIKACVDCDNRYYSAEIYDRASGKLIARRSPISFAGDETVGFLKFSALGISYAAALYIDNISIEKITESTLIYEDGFDYSGSTTATAAMSLGGASENIAGTSYFEGYTPWRALAASGKDYGLINDAVLESKVVRLGDDPLTSGTTEKSGLVYMPVKEKLLEQGTQASRGKLKISFKIKPDTVSDEAFRLNFAPEYSEASDALFEIVNNGGTPALVTDSGNVNLDASKWYDAEVVLDVAEQKATTVLKDHAQASQVAGFAREIASLTAVKGLIFNAVGGTTVHMDDVKLEYYKGNSSQEQGGGGSGGGGGDEDDSVETFEGYKTDDENLWDSLMENGWYPAGDMGLDTDTSAYPADLVKIVNYQGRKCLKIKAAKRELADEDIGIGKKFPEQGDAKSVTGSWEIKFKFFPSEQFLFSLNTADGSATDAKTALHNILAAYKSKMYIGYRDYMKLYNNGSSIPQGVMSGTSEWYDVKVIVNCDDRYYSVELYKDGHLIARRSPISFAGNETIGFFKVSALGLGKDNWAYIDNVSIKPTSKESLIYKDGFEYAGSAVATAAMSLGGETEDVSGTGYFEGYTPWRALASSGSDYGLINDAVLGSQTVRLGDDPDTADKTEASGLVYMPVYEKLVTPTLQGKRGKIRLSFSIKPSEMGDSGFLVNVIPDYNRDLIKAFEITNNSGTPALKAAGGNVDLDASKWYDAEVELDVINKTVTTVLKDHSTSAEIAAFRSGITSLTEVKGLVFDAVGGTTVYMDDVKIEYDDAAASIKYDEMSELMKIAAVKLNENNIGSISDITNGAEINVKIACSNKSDDSLGGFLFVAYYGDDMLLATSSLKPSIGGKEQGVKSFNFTVPGDTELDMSKVDRISVCLWKGFKNAAPYCDKADIVKASESGSVSAGSDASKPKITYFYNDSVLNISGKADANSKYLTVQILKQGNTFEASDGLANADDKVFYRAQAPITNGKYSLDIRFDTEQNAASTLVKGSYPAAIYIDGVKQAADSVFLEPYSDFTDVYGTVNKAASEDDFNAFKTALNEKRKELNFDSELLGGAAIDDGIRAYFDYVKANPLSAEKEAENVKKFNSYAAVVCLNGSKIDSIGAFLNDLQMDDSIKELCGEVLKTEAKDKYFTSLISGKNITDPAQLEKSIKEALILTSAKYGNGYGELKSVLELCGAQIDISAPISDAACRSLMGRSFNDTQSFKTAYDEAKKESQGSSGSGGSGGSSISSISVPVSEVKPNVSDASPIARTFNDIDNFEWAMTAILALADRNIISGVAEDRFEPARNITREEFAKILVEALGAAGNGYNGNVFGDAKEGDWFVGYINIAAQLGLVNGIGNGLFGTGRPITRQDMAVMIYNSLKYRNVEMNPGSFKFDDDGEIADYAKTAVGALHEMGAVNGMTETTFAPTGLATRAQAARMVYNVLDRLQGEEDGNL